MTRRTGRTYRKLLEACLEASRGKKVGFLYGTSTERKSLISTIMKFLPSDIHVDMIGGEIKFPEGIIQFRQVETIRGFKYDTVIIDDLSSYTWREIEKIMPNIRMLTL